MHGLNFSETSPCTPVWCLSISQARRNLCLLRYVSSIISFLCHVLRLNLEWFLSAWRSRAIFLALCSLMDIFYNSLLLFHLRPVSKLLLELVVGRLDHFLSQTRHRLSVILSILRCRYFCLLLLSLQSSSAPSRLQFRRTLWRPDWSTARTFRHVFHEQDGHQHPCHHFRLLSTSPWVDQSEHGHRSHVFPVLSILRSGYLIMDVD